MVRIKIEKMKIIGLTGGIGSGKSTVSAYLKSKGCRIINADALARQMTEKGSPALEMLRTTFGDKYFNEDGSLKRKELGAFVFAHPEQKKLLEGIVTKAVIDKSVAILEEWKKENYEGIVVLDAPLLFECGMQKYMDETWLVKADGETVIRRVMSRDGLSCDEIEGRIRAQMPLSEKEKLADRIIDNSRDLEYLYRQVDKLLFE